MNKIYLLSAGLCCALLAGCESLPENKEYNGNSSSAALTVLSSAEWQRPNVDPTPSTRLVGDAKISYDMGLERLTKPPFDKNFILADVNFNQKRWFTNFSGDISGRFIEVASDVSSADKPWPEVLPALLDEIGKYQKEDGHFGAPVDWSKPIDFNPTTDQTVMMPILWGNGRLLLGLTSATMKFNHPGVKEAAIKLGDFYVNTVSPRFCDPTRMNEYRTEGQYASAYVTCVYEGMEGLLNLYLVTGDKRYLDTACKFADFHEAFDVLPIGHSHGSLGQTSMLVRLYEQTGNKKYLDRAVQRWDAAVSGGYVNPAGSVLEKFWVTGHNMDEGCSEADWLRLNLLLWANTGQTRYLDMAERLYWNGIRPNQWSTGGFGHRYMGVDDVGPFSYMKPCAESLWCCSFHGPWALHKMLSYLAVGSDAGIWYNFPMYFETVIDVGGDSWSLKSRPTASASNDPDLFAYNLEIQNESGAVVPPVHIRVPEWAQKVEVSAWISNGDSAEMKKVDLTLMPSKSPGQNTFTALTKKKVKAGKLIYHVVYSARPFLENRKMQRVDLEKALADKTPRLDSVVYRKGPFVYMNKSSGNIEDIPFNAVNEKMAPFVFMTNKDEPHSFVNNLILVTEEAAK
jgi:hypothetical protein